MTSSSTSNLRARIYLLLAVAIFGAANSVTRKLTEIGSQHLIDGRNPISFCNVLFVGNLCALILLGIIYHGQWKFDILRQIKIKEWLILVLVTILGAVIAPTLIFIKILGLKPRPFRTALCYSKGVVNTSYCRADRK